MSARAGDRVLYSYVSKCSRCLQTFREEVVRRGKKRILVEKCAKCGRFVETELTEFDKR